MDELIVFTCSDVLDGPSRIRGKNIVDTLCANGFKALWIPYQARCRPYPEIVWFLSEFIRKCRIVQKSSPNSGIMIQRYISDFELGTWIRLVGISRLFRNLPKFTVSSLCFGLLSKFVFKRKLLYDIDDALFRDSPFEVSLLLKLSNLVVVGGHNLYSYAKKYNENVLLVPPSATVHERRKPTDREAWRLSLTFISGPGQLRYIQTLANTLGKLSKQYDFELRIMSALTPQHYLPYKKLFDDLEREGVRVVRLLWNPESESEELEHSDIGLAPLFGDTWDVYKCGFKIINYMSGGIPPVASAFGENLKIIKDGYDGFLCRSETEWYEKLGRLIEDERLRRRMGQNAFETAQEKFSIGKNARTLMQRIRRT